VSNVFDANFGTYSRYLKKGCLSFLSFLAYFFVLQEVDLGWLGENWEHEATDEDFEDDEKCLDYFHRFQTIRKLQQVRETIGPRDFGAVFETFDSIKNSGYSLDEIISTSTEKLIDRADYARYRVENGDDQEEEANDDSVYGEEWEQVPEDMTRVVGLAEDRVREAIVRSEASVQEDQQIRQAMEESLAEGSGGGAEHLL